MSASVQLDEKADYRLALKTYQLRMDELIAVSVSEMYVDTEKLHNRSEKTRFVKTTRLKQSTWSTLLPSPTPHLADLQKSSRPSTSKNKQRPDFCLFSDNRQRVLSEIKAKNPKETRFVKTTGLKKAEHGQPSKK